MRRVFLTAVLACMALVLWWLISPLERETVVEEPAPPAESSALSSASVPAIPESMIRALEHLTPEEFARKSPLEQQVMRGILERVRRSMADTAVDDPAVGGSVIASGTFRDAEDSSRGSGTAAVYRLPDGSRVLRFQDFRVTNGPALHVLLVADPLHVQDAMVDLGPLKGNVGNQNYAVPPNADLDVYSTVVIYSMPFSMPFASADLVAAN